MRQYVVDELRAEDHRKIKAFLDEKYGESPLLGVYRIPLDLSLLSDTQASHRDCQPFCFSIDLEPDRISFEFLIRSPKQLKCSCTAYATKAQREWIIQFADSIFEQEGIVF